MTQNPRDDAEARANNALTSYHQLAHPVFRNPRISLHLREQLANSLCISRLKFGVDTWVVLPLLPPQRRFTTCERALAEV